MADPTALTVALGSAAGVIGTVVAIVVNRRETKKAHEEDAGNTVASWSALNTALNTEVNRLNAEMERLRNDYEAATQRLRDDYERQLTSARSRISELENEVRVLHNLLGRS